MLLGDFTLIIKIFSLNIDSLKKNIFHRIKVDSFDVFPGAKWVFIFNNCSPAPPMNSKN